MRTNKAAEERLAAAEAASAAQSAEAAVAAVAALADGDEADSGKPTARAVLAAALSTLATVQCPQGHAAVHVYDGLPAARIQCAICAAAVDKPAAELLALLDRARTAVLEASAALDHGDADKVRRLWDRWRADEGVSNCGTARLLMLWRRVAGHRPAQGCPQGGPAVAPAARAGADLPPDLAGVRGAGKVGRRRRGRQGRRAAAGRGRPRLAPAVRCVLEVHKEAVAA